MDLFKLCNQTEKATKERRLKEISVKYKFEFPPLYYLFQTNFKVGQYIETRDCFLDEYLRPTPLWNIELRNNGKVISIYNWLLSPNQIDHNLKFFDRVQDILKDKRMLRIGDLGNKKGLFLGLENDGIDKVYEYNHEVDSKPFLIGENIFDLVNHLFLDKRTTVNKLELSKPISNKYWRKKNERLKLNSIEIHNLIKKSNNLDRKFIPINEVLRDLNKILKNVQNFDS